MYVCALDMCIDETCKNARPKIDGTKKSVIKTMTVLKIKDDFSRHVNVRPEMTYRPMFYRSTPLAIEGMFTHRVTPYPL